MYKKVYKKRVSGYMTLEAAFIIPWVIFLFVFLIYSGFYFYNKCVLFQDAYAICFRGSIQKDEGGVVDYINAHMGEQFGSKYFGVENVSGSVEKKRQSVIVYGTCSVKIPFRNFLTMAKSDGWQIQTGVKAQIINPTKVIRKCRMVENFFDGLS